jgi:hypothetical protein
MPFHFRICGSCSTTTIPRKRFAANLNGSGGLSKIFFRSATLINLCDLNQPQTTRQKFRSSCGRAIRRHNSCSLPNPALLAGLVCNANGSILRFNERVMDSYQSYLPSIMKTSNWGSITKIGQLGRSNPFADQDHPYHPCNAG